MAEHNDYGQWGEECAANYLVKEGYIIKERDWRLGHRDIDIIAVADDGCTLVFVEVKSRKDGDVIDPVEAVNVAKMRSIGYCANAYIKMCNLDVDCRFDIITIVGDDKKGVQLRHLKDAFNPCLL